MIYAKLALKISFVFLLLQLINYAMTTLLFSDRLGIIPLTVNTYIYRCNLDAFSGSVGDIGTGKMSLEI